MNHVWSNSQHVIRYLLYVPLLQRGHHSFRNPTIPKCQRPKPRRQRNHPCSRLYPYQLLIAQQHNYSIGRHVHKLPPVCIYCNQMERPPFYWGYVAFLRSQTSLPSQSMLFDLGMAGRPGRPYVPHSARVMELSTCDELQPQAVVVCPQMA